MCAALCALSPEWRSCRFRDGHRFFVRPQDVCAGDSRRPYPLEILRRIDADRIVLCFDGLNPDAVLERAELFERLGPFELASAAASPAGAGSRGDRRRARCAATRRRPAAVADERNRRAREIQREPVAIDDDLGHVGIVQLGRIVDATPQRHITSIGSSGKRRDRFVDHAGLDERFVSLDVDDEIAGHVRGDLRQPVRAALVIGRGHARLAAERAHRLEDALVVGRDDDGRDPCRRRGAPVDVLDHRPPADVRECLAREPGRVIAGGDNGDDSA